MRGESDGKEAVGCGWDEVRRGKGCWAGMEREETGGEFLLSSSGVSKENAL